MKKYIKRIGILSVLFLTLWSCEDTAEFGDLAAPDDLVVTKAVQGVDGANLNGDGTGIVNFTAKASNAISYKYIFSDGSSASSATGVSSQLQSVRNKTLNIPILFIYFFIFFNLIV